MFDLNKDKDPDNDKYRVRCFYMLLILKIILNLD